MNKIDFTYASKQEHNFAQRLIIKTIEQITGKRKLEKLYQNYALNSENPHTFWNDIINILEIILRNKRNIDLQNVNFLVKLFKLENILFKKEYYIKNIKPNETKIQIINPEVQYDKIEVIPFD